MEEFAFLKKEVMGKELLKGSLHFTGQCEAGLQVTGEGQNQSSLPTPLGAETMQVSCHLGSLGALRAPGTDARVQLRS